MKGVRPMVRGACRPPRERRGQALVEMAIALPVLALMVFGLTEVGFMIKTRLVLQDATRAVARYGSEAGTISGAAADTVAPLCQSDYYALDVIRDRLVNSLVDPDHVRAILIYKANESGDPVTSDHTGLPTGPYADVPVDISAVHGDYYYAVYDPNTGKNTSGDVYTLFHDPLWGSTIFPPAADTDPSRQHPPCGLTLRANVPLYDEYHLPALPLISPFTFDLHWTIEHPTPPAVPAPGSDSATTAPWRAGNWPPAFRNNQGTITGAPPDKYGVEVVYDYEFHTPVFSIFSNFGTSHHLFRMVDRAVFDLNPQ